MNESNRPHDLTERPLDELVACHECDLLMLKPRLAEGERAECPRCGFELFSHRPNMLGRSMALAIAALLLYIPANFLPILHLRLLGQTTQDTVWSAVVSLYESGLQGIAAVVFLCSMGVPLLKLLCQLAVLLTIHFDVGRSYGLLLYRIYHELREWGMLEVYLMGILVSIVKLLALADLALGAGLACFIGLLLLQLWLEVIMSPHQVWEALSRGRAHASH